MKCIFISTINYLSHVTLIHKWQLLDKSLLILCCYFSLDQYKSWKICCSTCHQAITQGCNQEFFGAGEVWNQGTSIKISCTPIKRKALQGKILVYFSQILKKQHFIWGHFHNKGTVFNFQERVGKTTPTQCLLHPCNKYQSIKNDLLKTVIVPWWWNQKLWNLGKSCVFLCRELISSLPSE